MTGRVAVIAELFSSEGCSSCPPADEVLARLDATQPVDGVAIVALELHVDYWNRLGWTDPFSSASFSARQYFYANSLGRDGVYTPQLVIDGRRELNGADARGAVAAIAEAARRPHARIALSAASRDSVRVVVEELPADARAPELWLAIVESGLSTDVPRGENGGRTLRHAPVVRALRRVGEVTAGASRTLPLSLAGAWRRDSLRAVVFVQEPASAHILGAATLALAQ
jgi:hypothetical protein